MVRRKMVGFPALLRCWPARILLASLLAACARPVAEAPPPAPQPTPQPTLTPTRISRPQTRAERARALATSVELVRDRRCREAVPLLRVLLDSYPEMEDYHLHHLATCAAASGDWTTAGDAWARLSRDHRDSIHVAAATLSRGQYLQRSGDHLAAVPLLQRAALAEDKSIAHRAQLALAEIELANKNVRSAYSMFAALRADAGPETRKQARGYVMALRDKYPELAPRGGEREDEVRALLGEGEHDEALRLTQALLATASQSERVGLLRVRAKIEKASGDVQRHLRTLRTVHTTYPRSKHAPEALYSEARWLWNKDSDAKAKKVFAELLRRYPGHRRAATARYALARIAQAAGEQRRAERGFRDVIKRHPRSNYASEARWQVAWMRYRGKRWREAEREFAKMARGSMRKSARAHYWRARALEHEGKASAAREIYATLLERAPDSYYAWRAAQRLGRSEARADDVPAPAMPFPALADSMRRDYHLFRAAELHSARLYSLARREVRAFERGDNDQPRDLMIDLHRAVDGHRRAIRLAAKDSSRYPEVLYPLAFWDLVRGHCARYDIDPLLALSLMRQESLFDVEARSPANARGLMQLLPRTADAVAARIGRGGRIDLYDPATNIELGTAHLRELADKYDGDHVRMLAAYNAGAAAVAKWDRRFGTLDKDEYVESITYSETRDYVKKVLRNYRRYQRMYGSG